MGKFLRGKVWIVNIPAKLLFVSFSLKLQIEMDGNEYLIYIASSFSHDVCCGWSEDELLINSFV
jgi:hypothetical protein